MPLPVHGPFETLEDVASAAGPLKRALTAADPTGSLTADARRARTEVRQRHLHAALAAADVGLGAYDQAVMKSIAGAPLETLVVLIDWLARAAAAGNAELLAEAAEYITSCPTPARPDGRCIHGPWIACETTALAWRLRGIDPDEARRIAFPPRRT